MLKIEYLPIKALKPYEKNTRKHQKKDVDNIARSIEDEKAVLINEQGG